MALAPDDPSFLERLAGFTGRNGGLSRATEQFGGAGNLGLQLLANSGYSTTPRTLGQTLGVSALQAQQAQQARNNDQLKRAYMEAQIKALQQPKERAAPASVAEYEYAKRNGFKGSFQDWITAGGQSSRPSSVQEWEFYTGLPPEMQQRYLEMKRNPNMVVKEIAGTQNVVAPSIVGGTKVTPLSTLPEEAAAASTLAGARASGEMTGKATTEARFDLPRVQANAEQALDVIKTIKNHPGIDYATGLASKIPVVPGTRQADFVASVEQLQGKVFLEAFQSLKGGGQITEVEGRKAEQAIARLQRSQSKASFLDALSDLETVVQRGAERARQKAGGTAPSARKRYNPETGKIE